jgi:hypothetical protein
VLGEGISLLSEEVIEIIGSGIYHRNALALRPRDGFSVMKLLHMIKSAIIEGHAASNSLWFTRTNLQLRPMLSLI